MPNARPGIPAEVPPDPGRLPADAHTLSVPTSGPLAVTRSGPADAARGQQALVLVHGFTQNAGAWGPLRADLAHDRRVLAVDLPGHGASSHITADLWETARLLSAVEPGADHLGYSLGARACLHLALAYPHAVRRLVLIGATPGIADASARAERRQADQALADRIEAGPLTDFLDRWLRQPLFQTLPADAACLPARLANTPAGLAASLRSAGTGSQEPLWDRLGALTMPVLLIAGALDTRFADVARAMAEAIGANASVSSVPGAGHACHLERPGYVAGLVRSFSS
ncbi:MAG: alpha/beta fold hydrolase [Actinomycetota bacterium]|nr:alpha/beta fold hydrolase [Actinomycetota bacterium]